MEFPARRQHPESALQRAVVKLLALREAVARGTPRAFLFFHPPNGGLRNPREAAIFKALGVRVGVPDIVLVYSPANVAFVELKAGKGRLSPAQEGFRECVQNLQCAYYVAWSVEDVEYVLDELVIG